MAESQNSWYRPIRTLHDKTFQETWVKWLEILNQQPAVTKSGVPFLLPHRDLPPAWFNGDIEHLAPRQWVLVVSLNPHIDPADHRLSSKSFSQNEWWDYWRHFNQGDNWKGSFFPRLVSLAASCLGAEVAPDETKRFATERMLFVEFCPYASEKFPRIPWRSWKTIATSDPGFGIARDIRHILFDYGQPALVLCNGQLATYDVKDQQFHVDHMHEYWIGKVEDPTDHMSLFAADYTPKEGYSFPVVGFNQLGRRKGREKSELELIRRFVREEDVLMSQS